MNLLLDDWQHLILSFDRKQLRHLEEFFHLVDFLDLLDEDVLGDL